MHSGRKKLRVLCRGVAAVLWGGETYRACRGSGGRHHAGDRGTLQADNAKMALMERHFCEWRDATGSALLLVAVRLGLLAASAGLRLIAVARALLTSLPKALL